MFLQPSDKINTLEWHKNYQLIFDDFSTAMDIGYHFDYKHEIDISNPKNLNTIKKQLTQTDYFWQVSPLIYNREPIPFLPEKIKNCHTIKMLMDNNVKPIFAVFSVLAPHSEIDPHVDTDDEIVTGEKHIPWQNRNNSIIKYHFGIDVPNDNYLVVNDNVKQIHENKLLCFDETNIHYAYNQNDKKRGVLIVSYLKSEL